MTKLVLAIYDFLNRRRWRNVAEPLHFYHGDHLGSAAYLTDRDGHVVQTLAYLPYGEDWVEQNSLADTTRLGMYRYNGKEKDYESGYHYYGARYYWSELWTGWLSVDPMSDKYPSISPYAYCAWNPVKLVDPDGREIVDDWYKNNSTKCYEWKEGSESIEGYTYIGGEGSVLGEYEPLIDNILKEYGHKGLYREGLVLDIAPNDKGALWGSKERGWDFFDEFASGTGPEISILTENHPYTKSIQNAKQVKKAQELIMTGHTDIPGRITNVESKFGIKGALSSGFSIAKQFIGSFRFDAYTSKNGKYLYNIVSDCKSLHSLLYHATPSSLDRQRTTGSQEFSNTYQFYIWTIPK